MNIGCVVMAAGRSVRFGKNKLLAPLAGRPLLAHVLDALPRESLARIIAVTSDGAVTALCEARGVRAVQYDGGPQSETVRRGMEQMSGMDACLFVQGDQPLCSERSVKRLLDDFARSPESVFRLAYDGVPGSPVVFPKKLFAALSALTGATDSGRSKRSRSTSAAATLWTISSWRSLCKNFVKKENKIRNHY